MEIDKHLESATLQLPVALHTTSICAHQYHTNAHLPACFRRMLALALALTKSTLLEQRRGQESLREGRN